MRNIVAIELSQQRKKEVSSYCPNSIACQYVYAVDFVSNVLIICFSVTTVCGSLSHSVSSVVFAFQYGDVIMTVEESGERGQLWFPAPGLSAHCVDGNPAGDFLKIDKQNKLKTVGYMLVI